MISYDENMMMSIYGNMTNKDIVAAKCNCSACNSCSCGRCYGSDCISQCTGCRYTSPKDITWDNL